jgi:hypothetical protein
MPLPTPRSDIEVPAYLLRSAIRIAVDRKGRARATYFSMPSLRWLPVPLDMARLALAAQAEAA